MQKFKFKLFVTDDTLKSRKAINQVKQILEKILEETELEIIDVLEHPEIDESYLIVTPMLVKVFPKPEKRVLGDFDDIEKTLRMLGLSDVEQS
jgi:circadian clock protein KaiB